MTKFKSKYSLTAHINNYIEELQYCLKNLNIRKIEKIIDILMKAYSDGKKVFIIGNGGSASNASHMAADLSKGTLKRFYDRKEKRFKVYSLTDNVALLTAYGNDLSFSDIFLQQMANLIEAGDVVIALSGSGNSENIIRAVKYAKKCNAKTVGILGFKTGGKVAKLTDLSIIVQSKSYGPCEDIQLILDHIITGWITNIKSDKL